MPRSPATAPPRGQLWVAKTDFVCDLDGVQEFIRAGQTRVRAGHRLLERYAECFEPADVGVEFDVEQATAAPGERRGARPVPQL